MKTSSLRFALYLSIAFLLAGCSGSAHRSISVGISGASSTIAPAGTFNLTADVSNDRANAGVTWALTGAGALSAVSTTGVIYTAPPLPVPANPSVTITATSISDPTKSATVTFTITAPALSVNITNPIATTVAGSAAVTVNATVTNDGATPGVSWNLYTTGTTTACAPACGQLSVPSRTAVTYTPPATVPATPTATIVATSLSDSTQSADDNFTITAAVTAAVCQPSPASRGNEVALSAPYAFLVKGEDATGAALAYAGSFTPNGKGGITAADVDSNGLNGGPISEQVDVANSSYAFGADGRGCLYLAFNGTNEESKRTDATNDRHAAHAFVNPSQARRGTPAAQSDRRLAAAAAADTGSVTFSMAISTPYGIGRITEFDNTSGAGSVTAGQMHVQSPSQFSLAAVAANFAFGVDGWTLDDGPTFTSRTAIAGSFANNNGGLSLGVADTNIAGMVSGVLTGGSGNLSPDISSTTGRGTGLYAVTDKNSDLTFNFAYYVVNGADLFIISSDSSGVLSGRALESAPSSSFPDGYYITASTGLDCTECSDSNSGSNVISISTLQISGTTVPATTVYSNDDGDSTTTTYSGSYTLDAPSGRVVFSGITATPPIAYVTSTSSDDEIEAFTVGTDTNTSSGFIATQSLSKPNFTAASLPGPYAFGTAEDIAGTRGSAVGQITFDGNSVFTLTQDATNVGSASNPNQALSGSYTVKSDGSGMLSFGEGSIYIVTNSELILGFDGSESAKPLLYVYVTQTAPPDRAKSALHSK